jgi:hypothetical protein
MILGGHSSDHDALREVDICGCVRPLIKLLTPTMPLSMFAQT